MEKTGKHFQSGGLAGSVRSEKPDDLTLTQIEGGSLDRHDDLVLAGDQASQGSLQPSFTHGYLEGSTQVFHVDGCFYEDSY
jgi:hypothetical protein